MNITNEQAARDWLAAWSGRPRRSILQATIDGLTACVVLADERRHTETNLEYRSALAVLQDAWRKEERIE